MKYLQKLDTKIGYLTYDYVASWGDYDKCDDSFNNGVVISDEPLNKYVTLFYTTTNVYGVDNTYYNDLSTLTSTITGVPYSNIKICFRLVDDSGYALQPYRFEYEAPSGSGRFLFEYRISSGVGNFRLYDSLTFPNNTLEFYYDVGPGSDHPFSNSSLICVAFDFRSSNVISYVSSSNPNDHVQVYNNQAASPSESEFRSTPIFIPTQWSTNTYDEGQRFTIEWMYYPGAYMSQLTPDETPKQIQLNSENV